MSEVGKGWRSFIKGRKFWGETGVAIVMFLLVVVLPRVWHSRCKIQTACDCRDFHSIRKEDRMLTQLRFSLGIPNSSLVRIYIPLWTETLWNWCALLKDTPLSHVEFPFSKVSFFSKLYRGARFLFYCFSVQLAFLREQGLYELTIADHCFALHLFAVRDTDYCFLTLRPRSENTFEKKKFKKSSFVVVMLFFSFVALF